MYEFQLRCVTPCLIFGRGRYRPPLTPAWSILYVTPLTLDGMTYGIPVYGMTSEKAVPPGLPAIVFLRNFARVEGQQNQEVW